MENEKPSIIPEIIRNVAIGAVIAAALGLLEHIIGGNVTIANGLAQRLLDSPAGFRPESLHDAQNTIIALHALMGGALGFAFGPLPEGENVENV